MLINKTENQTFGIVEPPALEVSFKNKQYPVYLCDAEKGVTVGYNVDRDKALLTLYCDPKMLSNVFDESFISMASGIKADFKQLLGVGLGAFIFGGLTGLLF